MTFYEVVSFVRSSGGKFSKWTEPSIASYLQEHTKKGTIRVATDGTKVLGVIVFDPSWGPDKKLFIEQVWGERKLAMRIFVRQLVSEFPNVTSVWGWRHGNRAVEFNLNTLRKIYGR